MKYLLFAACGLAAGVIGGMGMGGGTILIPLLTLLCGLPQKSAQAINLISFIPTAAVALVFYAKKGLLDYGDAPYLILPGTAFAAAFAYIGGNIGEGVITRVFGGLLILLSAVQVLFSFNKKNRQN
ncbi:MAG: sulfite exporter TauE/SafE family protein [Clostridia bacterium]|nr:sulfite exporter TauE/SafE family protein [Clostridia bacterium]